MTADSLSHVDATGRPVMVDVGGKPETDRRAVATGCLVMSAEAFARLSAGEAPKGAVEPVARIAGIQAAKRTSELIPMCHPLALSNVKVDIAQDESLPGLRATAEVSCRGSTGVEMEALTAVSVALLAAYDMLKAIDRGMHVADVHLLEKHGGASGSWTAPL